MADEAKGALATRIDQAGTLPARILDALADGDALMVSDLARLCNTGPSIVRGCLRYMAEEGLVRVTRPRNRGEHWSRPDREPPEQLVLSERGRKGADAVLYRRARACHACGARMRERQGSVMLVLVCPACDARRQLAGVE